MISKRQLGKTGVMVSLFSLGGEAAIEKRDQPHAAETIINHALDLGVNYMDTSPTYGDGGSEENIGRVMAYRRQDVFLSTKTHDRTYDGTMRLLESSLTRLQTDHLDMYQIHDIRQPEDLETIFDHDGALRAVTELKDQGVIRFLGITSHKVPDVLLEGIRRYPFDCVLCALNAGDIHHAPFTKELIWEASKRDMGIIAMKVTAVGRIFKEGGLTSMQQALGYTCSYPISTAIVGVSNVQQVEENVAIATDFKPFTELEMRQLESLTAPYAYDANFFKHEW
jgi:hypothetical protein